MTAANGRGALRGGALRPDRTRSRDDIGQGCPQRGLLRRRRRDARHEGIGPPGSYRGPIHRFGSRGFRALTSSTQWQYHGGHGKRLEPSRSCSVRDVSGRFAVLADPSVAQSSELKALENAARARGVELVTFTGGAAEQIVPVMGKAKASGATVLKRADCAAVLLQSPYRH